MIGLSEFRMNWLPDDAGEHAKVLKRRCWVGKELYLVRLARLRSGAWRPFIYRESCEHPSARRGPSNRMLPEEPNREYAERSAWGFLKLLDKERTAPMSLRFDHRNSRKGTEMMELQWDFNPRCGSWSAEIGSDAVVLWSKGDRWYLKVTMGNGDLQAMVGWFGSRALAEAVLPGLVEGLRWGIAPSMSQGK